MKRDPWKNGKSLEKFLDSDKSEDFRDRNFHYSVLDCDNCKDYFSIHPIPYWIENYQDEEKFFCKYIEGYWLLYEPNSEVEIEGERYIFIDTIPLPEEEEHQADNGDLVYEYRGPSHLMILEKRGEEKC